MRTTALLIPLTVLTVALSSCGDSGGDEQSIDGTIGAAATGAPFDPDAPLEEEQVTSLLLEETDLDTGYKEQATDGENDAFKCLSRFDDLQEFGSRPATYDERTFSAESGPSQGLSLFNGVGSYESESAAEDTFADLAALMESCTSVRMETSGYRYRLRLDSNRDATSSADEQVNLSVEGNTRYKLQKTYPFGGHYTLARTGNEIVIVALIGVTDKDQTSVAAGLLDNNLDKLTTLEATG